MLHMEHYFAGFIGAYDDSTMKRWKSIGGLFLEESAPASFVSLISQKNNSPSATVSCSIRRSSRRRRLVGGGRRRGVFLSVSLSSLNDGVGDGGGESYSQELTVEKSEESECEGENETAAFKESVEEKKSETLRRGGGGTLNTAKHLWSGAVAAMVSTFAI